MSVNATPVGGNSPSAQEMVDYLRNALRSSPGTAILVEVDGQKVQYSRSEAIAELKYWERQVEKEAGRRRRVRNVRLDGF